jgi:hypothetical protein
LTRATLLRPGATSPAQQELTAITTQLIAVQKELTAIMKQLIVVHKELTAVTTQFIAVQDQLTVIRHHSRDDRRVGKLSRPDVWPSRWNSGPSRRDSRGARSNSEPYRSD